MDRSAAYDFLLMFRSNHGPISDRFRDKRQVQSKIAKFPPPLVFCAPAERVPLIMGYWRWGQKTRMMGYRAEKEVWRYLQPCGYNAPTRCTDRQTDRQTEGRTDAGRYSKASRGKKNLPPLTCRLLRFRRSMMWNRPPSAHNNSSDSCPVSPSVMWSETVGLRPKNRSWSWSCRSGVVLWNTVLLRSSS